MNPNYVKPRRIYLTKDPRLDERWIQNLIADDPSVLGLGDLELRDKERNQPRAGRLDLLLQDPESKRRYEVEIQLGATDESHIIRTIEYYDIEKKRYPQYEHCAVLVAEDITSRFLNVVSLFNGMLPLIAIQMQVFAINDSTTVVFTKVLDELTYGVVDEDEDTLTAPTNRTYWKEKATETTVGLADRLLNLLRNLDDKLDLNYTKHYIGIEKNGRPFNFVSFNPTKNLINFGIRLPRTDETDAVIDSAGLDTLPYDIHHGQYRLQLSADDIDKKSEILSELSNLAYKRKTGS